jgi:hypothetical protein
MEAHNGSEKRKLPGGGTGCPASNPGVLVNRAFRFYIAGVSGHLGLNQHQARLFPRNGAMFGSLGVTTISPGPRVT